MSRPTIRQIEPDDLPRVAEIFLRVFRRGEGSAPRTLIAHLRELFLEHPHHDPETRSLVHVRADGVLDGFIGALPQPMLFRGRVLRGVVGTCLMVEDPRLSPAAGGQLLRRQLNGPQDISLTDTANHRSLDLQRALRCHLLPTQSLQWTKILRTASSAVSIARERLRSLRAVPMRHAAGLADRAFGFSEGLYHRPRGADSGWSDADISDDEFAEIFLSHAGRFELGPAWSRRDLSWILAQARRKTKLGPICVRGVFGPDRRPLGAYAYYGRPLARAVVLQIVARPRDSHAVLTSLFDHALAQACPMVQGAAQPFLMEGLFRIRGIVFRHDCGTSVRARDPAIIQALDAGNGLIGGMVGEGWTRLVSDDLDDAAPAGMLSTLAGRLRQRNRPLARPPLIEVPTLDLPRAEL